MEKWSTRFVLSFIAVFMIIPDSLASEEEDYRQGLNTSFSFQWDIDIPLETGGVDPAFLDEVHIDNYTAHQKDSPVTKKKPIKRERDSSVVEEARMPRMLRPEIHYHILANFSDEATGMSAPDIIKRLRLAVPSTKTILDGALRNHYLRLQKNQGWLTKHDEEYYITKGGLKARESLGIRYGLSANTEGHKKLKMREAPEQNDDHEDVLDLPLQQQLSAQVLSGEEESSSSSSLSSGESSEHIKLPTRIRILMGDRTTVFEPATGRSVTTYNHPTLERPQNYATLPVSMKHIIMNISERLLLPQLLNNEEFIEELKHDLINGLRFGLAQTLRGVGIVNADRDLELMLEKHVQIHINQIAEDSNGI